MKSRYEPFLGTATSFRMAFPHVNTLKFVGRQRADTMSDNFLEDHYSADSLPQVVRCANPRCQQGGYDLLPYILLLGPGKSHYKGEMGCKGHEGSPNGVRKGDPCWDSLTFSITATFHPEEPTA